MTIASADIHARRHPITHDGPAVDFFAGALLGNGGLGAVVTTRPDAIVVHFGHNNVWDIRIAEDHKDKIGTFKEIFARVQAIPAEYERLDQDPWFRDYAALMAENYAKPYPRPFPCGSLVLGFDQRHIEVLGHTLDIADGVCRVRLLADGSPLTVELFIDRAADYLWLRVVDAAGMPAPAPFERVRLLPDPDGLIDEPDARPAGLFTALASLADTSTGVGKASTLALGRGLSAPAEPPERTLSFRQVLPFQRPEQDAQTPGHPGDRAFRLTARFSTALAARERVNWYGVAEPMNPLERAIVGTEAFVGCVRLDEGLAAAITVDAADLPAPQSAYSAAAEASCAAWTAYWARSSVALDDDLLEQTWYRNLYFFACAVRPGVICPGLFANWSYRRIGSAWHGDYHMNYNTQQPFWLCFSSNHVDLHLAYVTLVEQILPLSRSWARDYYGLAGAYFPHSAYPVEMSMMPYPVPTWGWEICETPWTVQSLWWHYTYTLDRDFLEQRAFEPLYEAVLFLVEYMRRPEAHGAQWGDDRYHIFPTVPPELYGLTPGFRRSYDCLVDLTLTKFVFEAYLEACAILGRTAEHAELIAAVREILAHFPAYPMAETPEGPIFVSVPGERADTVYNVPNPAMTVFPGEEHGLDSPPEIYAIAARSYRNQRIEGGNDLVFANLQGARLGLLDLERFKRQIRYCMLPNGTCTDMVLQVHGRYSDTLPFDFMADMGIWFENFALPAVINECLLQSYNGTIRLFPNWPLERAATFHTLRARDAFLVSAQCGGGAVQWVEILSEQGAPLRVLVPWATGARIVRAAGEERVGPGVLAIATTAGETLRIVPA